uniref:Uncharacterized protein n=1 Tax=Anopheles farauti TaxID=69004 RepID=A0A182PZK9_9DIPT
MSKQKNNNGQSYLALSQQSSNNNLLLRRCKEAVKTPVPFRGNGITQCDQPRFRSSLKMSPVLCRLAGTCSGRNASSTGRFEDFFVATSSSSSCTTSLSLVHERSVSFPGRGGGGRGGWEEAAAQAGTSSTIVDDSAPELPPVSASSGVDPACRRITISSLSAPSSESISVSPLAPVAVLDLEPLPMRNRRAKCVRNLELFFGPSAYRLIIGVHCKLHAARHFTHEAVNADTRYATILA